MTLMLAIALALILLTWLIWRPAKSYLTYRGERIITCPGNNAPAAVRVDAGQAAFHSNARGARHRLKSCSRWPEQANCGQDCLNQVEADPAGTRVTSIATRWYSGRSCALCGTQLDHLDWTDRRAALMNDDRTTRTWESVPPEDLPGIFATNRPTCWSCHIAKRFREQFPERVTDRLEHP